MVGVKTKFLQDTLGQNGRLGKNRQKFCVECVKKEIDGMTGFLL